MAEFGTATVGAEGATRTIVLGNSGNYPASFFVAVVAGGDSGSFQLLEENCSAAPLAPGATCRARVRFRPAGDPGSRVARLAMFGDGDSGAQVMLAGTAVAPRLSINPSELDFGDREVGTAGSRRTVTVANRGDGPVAIDLAGISGADPDQFRIGGDDCSGATLSPGASCELRVRFVPDGEGAKRATLAVIGGAGRLTVALSGRGASPPEVPPTASAATAGGFELRLSRRALRPRGGSLLTGWARCRSGTTCRVVARARVLVRARSRHGMRVLRVALPATRVRLRPGGEGRVELRLGRAGRLVASGRAQVRVRLVWNVGGRLGWRAIARPLLPTAARGR